MGVLRRPAHRRKGSSEVALGLARIADAERVGIAGDPVAEPRRRVAGPSVSASPAVMARYSSAVSTTSRSAKPSTAAIGGMRVLGPGRSERCCVPPRRSRGPVRGRAAVPDRPRRRSRWRPTRRPRRTAAPAPAVRSRVGGARPRPTFSDPRQLIAATCDGGNVAARLRWLIGGSPSFGIAGRSLARPGWRACAPGSDRSRRRSRKVRCGAAASPAARLARTASKDALTRSG
jgi:hypothetical protein